MTARALPVRVYADAEALARAAAEEFASLAAAAVARRGRFQVALCGGRTPRRLYEILAGPGWRERVAWEAVDVFWGDERAVGPDHPDSNYRLAAETLLDKVGIDPARVHRLRAEAPDRSAVASGYQREMAAVLGANPEGPPPALDLILLGLGADGHTASLFPSSPALPERRRWVVVQYVARLGTDRFTMTPPLINQARDVRGLVTGADKAEALRHVLLGPADPERWPAQLVRPLAGRLAWLVDEAAAASLEAR